MCSRFRYITHTLLFTFALWSAIFGVSYAYQLHYFGNAICAWLVLLQMSESKLSFDRFNIFISSDSPVTPRTKKRP